MKIGSVECGNIILAPMAGITDMPFRALCREQGATFSYTEMISAKALYYKNKNTLPLLQVADGERPIAVQLFGSEPELLAQEALKLEEGPYDIFDVNMGCPVPKVVNNGEGSALMRDPEKIGQIVSAMTKVLHKPVTIKIRKGFSADQINAVEVAKRAEDAGAAAIAIHGRTREEYYSGEADWDSIRLLKDNINIPVIANGNIVSRKSMEECLDYTKADGVMIARASLGDPGVFSELKTGTGIPVTKELILHHYQLSEDEKGEYTALKEMRKHLLWYLKGRKYAASLKNEAVAIENRGSFMGFVEKVFGEDL